MTERNKNNIPYSTSDIEKYRKGELSARQMHDLEQAALDDPFLADAMEGLLQNPVPQLDFEELHKRLNTKVTEDKRRAAVILIRRRIAVAATIILLLGLGYTFFRSQTKSSPIAKETAPAASGADSTTIFTPPAPPAAETPAVTHAVTHAAKHRAPATQPAAASATGYADSKLAADSPITSNYKTYNFKSTTAQTENKLKLPPLHPARLNDTLQLRSAYLSFAANPVFYSGKVLDLQNRPVAGAFLALNGNTGVGTTTDEHGQFRIALRRPDTTQQLTVSMIGFNRASLDINELNADDAKFNVIHLKPSTTNLDEVVVVGYGKKRIGTEVAPPSDSDEKLDTLWTNAAPVVGRQAYLQYIDAAKKKLGVDSTIRGTETISFLVSRDGSLTGLKIEQSISPAHDAGIIQLVTDGPAWRILHGRKVRASVTINF